MTKSYSSAKSAYVTVELHGRGSSVENDAQVASLAIAEWLDTQDTGTLADDFAEFMKEMNGDGQITAGARRYQDLWGRAYKIGKDAAALDWLCFFTLEIEPRG